MEKGRSFEKLKTQLSRIKLVSIWEDIKGTGQVIYLVCTWTGFLFSSRSHIIMKIFANNDLIKVYKYGLEAKNENFSLSTAEDASLAFNKGGNEIAAILKPFSEFISSNEIDHINLMKISIEGGEYDLLDHILAMNLVTKVENLQIQFHHFVPNAEQRMKTIQDKLSKTHELTYSYHFFWENWRKKKES